MATAREIIGRSAGSTAGGSGSRDTSRPWFVESAATELEAISAVALAAPALVDGLVITGITVDEATEDGYNCSADYGLWKPKAPPVIGDSSFSFEVSTQPQRILLPLSAQTVYPRAGETAPADSSTWLIGQQGDGSAPEGAEVSEPIASFAETHWLDAATITAAQQRVLLRTVGRLNAAAFRGWQAEEVMCTGVSGSQRGEDDWEISFRFSVREHQVGLAVAGVTGISKKGWQYLWPRYELQKDSSEPVISNVVKYVVVADVFKTADFALLGI